MKNCWRGALFLIFAIAALAVFSNLAQAAERPNIVFIFADDHATNSISCYGSKINETPNIDRIAKEGMVFENCFCTNALCGPSRAVILTGKFSHINGFQQNGDKFDISQPTFPKMLRKSGYQMALIGKWHLRTDPVGFDYTEILPGQGNYWNPPMIKNGKRVKHTGYVAEIITDLGLDWLKTGRDESKPFMLMLQHKSPHRAFQSGTEYYDLYADTKIPEPPTLFDDYKTRGTAAHTQDMTIKETLTPRDLKLTPPPRMNKEQLAKWHAFFDPRNAAFKAANLKGKDLVRWKYQRYIKEYLRCVAAVDDSVGRVLDYLDKAGLAENTVVIYSADQGFFLGEHGWFDKRFMYEESLRMPFIVRWPGVVKPGSRNDDLVQNVDYAETFLDIAGQKIPEDMQGRSLVPLMKGQTPDDWRTAIYYHYYEYPSVHEVQRHYGIRTDRYKLMHFYNVGEWELYDLKKDPLEMHNIFRDPNSKEILAKLKEQLEDLRDKYDVPLDTDPVPPPGNSRWPKGTRPVSRRG